LTLIRQSTPPTTAQIILFYTSNTIGAIRYNFVANQQQFLWLANYSCIQAMANDIVTLLMDDKDDKCCDVVVAADKYSGLLFICCVVIVLF
jgi:hypothetical protein